MDAGKQVSRRRIGRIMKQEWLVSNYTTAQFKPQKDTCNESKTENVLNRQFQNREYREVVISVCRSEGTEIGVMGLCELV